MYLKSLELSGFKSFAKKSSLTFSSRITGIVGPNGSGKSNSAEAFRFVLGEQSIKSLRGKRGEDMIWNGGGEAGRANRASVKLCFDNNKRLFSGIDFDEVVIERVVHRDNTNEYFLNGTQVRLKDIAETLASAHIGATGHHIISQGEADRILSASIRERREMIEDALGLKIYQWKKLESIRKLEKTEENMERVASLRREIAPHLKFLKKQVEKVERAEEMRRELIEIYKVYFYKEDKYLSTEKARLTEEISGPQKEIEELNQQLEKAKKILIDTKTKDIKSEEIIDLEGKLAETRIKKDNIVRELGRLEGEINANKRAIEKEEMRLKNEESRTVYVKDIEDVISTIEKFESIDNVKKLYSDVISTLKNFVSKHRSNIDSLLISDIQKEITIISTKKNDYESQLNSLKENEINFIRDYDELRKNIEKEKDTNRDAEKDIFRIIARQNEIRNVISNLGSALSSIKHQEEDFKKELTEAGIIAGREAINFQDQNIISNHKNTTESKQENRRYIEKLKIRLEDSGGIGGSEVLKEYKETEERDIFLGHELEDLEKAKKELSILIADLDIRIDYEFKSGILKINAEFQKFFSLMFGGGTAELIVVKEIKRKKKNDTDDLSSLLSDEQNIDFQDVEKDENGPEGLDVNVSLPRKKIKGLMMLSGGERALTSIALLFAVSQVNPPPFIILDETDAALDEANSKKYGDMIENLAEHSQLILITHNRETMSRAGVLYGVTMGNDGSSKLLSIQFDEAVKVAK